MGAAHDACMTVVEFGAKEGLSAYLQVPCNAHGDGVGNKDIDAPLAGFHDLKCKGAVEWDAHIKNIAIPAPTETWGQVKAGI